MLVKFWDIPGYSAIVHTSSPFNTLESPEYPVQDLSKSLSDMCFYT